MIRRQGSARGSRPLAHVGESRHDLPRELPLPPASPSVVAVPPPCTRDTDCRHRRRAPQPRTCPLHARYRPNPCGRRGLASDPPRARAIPIWTQFPNYPRLRPAPCTRDTVSTVAITPVTRLPAPCTRDTVCPQKDVRKARRTCSVHARYRPPNTARERVSPDLPRARAMPSYIPG